MPTILVVGSGLMADCLVPRLLVNPAVNIIIASHLEDEAKALAQKNGERCSNHFVNVQDKNSLGPLVEKADIVVSYIPAFLHCLVAHACLEHGKHLVTASYVSPEMQQLHEEAVKKGLIFLNELGLDPGIDHLATMKIIDETYSSGGKIVEYESWCGGLPSPPFCDNPLGYKFTWSPIGAFRALNNKAIFIDNGARVELEPAHLLYHSKQIKLNQALTLQGYPNRDSTSYRDIYGLKDAKRVLRGTLRYEGFTELVSAFKELELLQQKEPVGASWLEQITKTLEKTEGGSLQEKIVNKTVYKVEHYANHSKEENETRGKRILSVFKYFGLLSPTKLHDPKMSVLENFVQLMKGYLSLGKGETDLVAMQHRFVIEREGKRFLRKSSMMQIGEKKGWSAMSFTVSTPTAIGVELILEGKISERGVLRPIYKDIYEPAIERMQKEGIRLIEEEIQL